MLLDLGLVIHIQSYTVLQICAWVSMKLGYPKILGLYNYAFSHEIARVGGIFHFQTLCQ